MHYTCWICLVAWLLLALYAALIIKGTVTFQLAPGELYALIIEGTIPFQLAPGKLVFWLTTHIASKAKLVVVISVYLWLTKRIAS